jgi:uncharacterized DUF497 family protein
MDVVFDTEKDRANQAKHGISLARARDIEIEAVITDDRFDYGEDRYRAFGLIDSVPHCLVFTVRGSTVRAISLRRAHSKEMRRHAGQKQER